MAKVLRDSKGRWAGSTKGWGKGKGKGAKAHGGAKIARATISRATKTGSKRVLKNVAKAVGVGVAVGAYGGGLNGLAGVQRGKRLGKTIALGAAVGGGAGLLVGVAGSARTFKRSASRSARTGLSNRAAAKLRKANPKLTKSESYKQVYDAQRQGKTLRKAYKAYKGAK